MPMLTNMTASTSATSMTLASQRQTMVDCQIRTFDVTDQIVLDRFLATPRESYVLGKLTLMAYSDVWARASWRWSRFPRCPRWRDINWRWRVLTQRRSAAHSTGAPASTGFSILSL